MAKKIRKRKVQATRINWDVEFLYDIMTHNGFVITEPAYYKMDDAREKSLYGSRSILYGTNYEDENAFIEDCRCKCGEFKGAIFEGETCPYCNEKVMKRGLNIEFTGWIALGGYYVLNPFYYSKLSSIMGEDTLRDICMVKNIVDVNGNSRPVTVEDLEDAPDHPFYGIGLDEFRIRFEEIMQYFLKKKKKKEPEIRRILKESSSVFCGHIPIYSTALRPTSTTQDTYYFNTIDRHINPLFSLSEKLKSATDIERSYILGRIQYRVNALWAENFELLNGKEGFIRGQILGGSLNNTARNVIVPDPTLHDNEVDLSYHTFLELFRFKIIYYLMKMNHTNLAKANHIWKMAKTRYNNQVYEVMQFIVKKERPHILMNRNPTLNYYSMLLMRIRSVKKDFSDYTLSIPLSVLSGLNADFDGDIINAIGLVIDEFIYAFRKFDPVTRMIISRDTGLLHEYFTITKDQLIDLFYFATLE